jgi:transposase-like protein
MKINQINGLNRKARKFLLSNCVSKRAAEVMAYGFNGYINGENHEDETLIRVKGKWQVCSTGEKIISIGGEICFFSVTENTIS